MEEKESHNFLIRGADYLSKHADFKLVTRHATLGQPAHDTTSIYQAALGLLDRLDIAGRAFRLVGVAGKELVRDGEGQTGLFPDPEAGKRARLERALHGVRARFGDAAVMPADLGRFKRPT